MEKKVNFVFIDESVTEAIDLASLTGLVVPLGKFENIRTDFFKILKEILSELYPNQSHEDYPPILHAKSFLQNSKENKDFDFSNITDDFRIHIIGKVVKIVSDFDLFVIRIGYNNYHDIIKFRSDDKLHGLNWIGLSRTLDSIFNDSILIPVMEGIDINIVSKFSNIIWQSNCIRELDPKLSKSLIYNNSHNFYGSVFFTQSRYTECIQIVDIISYLLQKEDFIRAKGTSSNYNKMLVSTLSQLKSHNLINSIIKMNINSTNPDEV